MVIKPPYITKGIAWFTLICSLIVIAGWIIRIPDLTSLLPDSLSMKFNTAASFVLLSLAVIRYSTDAEDRRVRYFSIAIITIACLSLLEYVFGINLGIDELFVKDFSGAPNTFFPGRPSAFTAFCFLLLGIVLIVSRVRNNEAIVWLSLMVVVMIGGMVVLSFALGIDYLNSYARLTKVAFPTALLFLLNAIGIGLQLRISTRDRGFVRRLVLVCGILMGSLSMIFYYSNEGNERDLATARVFENTRSQIQELENAMHLLTNIESSTRGYLLAGDGKLLNRLEEDKIQLQNALSQMRDMIGDDSLQLNRLDSMQSLVLKRISLFSDEINMRQKNQLDQKILQPMVIQSATLMDSIRRLQARFIKDEDRQYVENRISNSEVIIRSGRVVYLLGFLMLCIIGILIVLIIQNTRSRIAAEKKADQLESTFEEKLQEQTGELLTDFEEMQRLATHLKDAREDERLQISLTVHDQIGQLASAIKMDLEWLDMQHKGSGEGEKKRLGHALTITDVLIDTSRKLAMSIRPAIIDELGITAALKWQCSEFQHKAGIPCHFRHSLDEELLDKNTRTELFRVCQEALDNVSRHAGATEVSVQLEETDTFVEMRIEDNGVGFDIARRSEGVGLISIRERAHSIGGELTIDSAPDKGTRLIVRVPKRNMI
jgi:signal transduction histidine kinase